MFAEKLKNARKLKGLTQQELSEKSLIVKSLIGRYETGATVPSTTNMRRLANALKLPITYFTADNPNETTKKEVTSDEKEFQKKLRSIKKFNDIERKVIEDMIDIIMTSKIKVESTVKKAKELAEIHSS